MALIYKKVSVENVSAEAVVDYAEQISGQRITRFGSPAEGYDLRWEFNNNDCFHVNIKAKGGELTITYYWDSAPSLFRLMLYCLEKMSLQDEITDLNRPLPWVKEQILTMDSQYFAACAKDARWIWGYIYIGIALVVFIFIGLLYMLWRLIWHW